MKKIALILILAVAFCFALGSLAQAGPPVTKNWAKINLKNKIKTTSIPIWQITQDGTILSVTWEDHGPNPRFAIYDVNGDNAGGEAYFTEDLVLDKETGLVWTRQTVFLGNHEWEGATFCSRSAVARGNRKGWRLPTAEELSSLVDPSESDPALPIGHPFINVQLDYYWSSTTREPDSSRAWAVNMSTGAVGHAPKTHVFYAWPVRGGNGYATGNW